MINVNNLKKGQVIKNYKELCEVLEEEVKFGNSKKAQVCQFERYFSYHKEGNKFVIDEIYDEPKEDSNLKFAENIDKLMEDMFILNYNNESGVIEFTINQFMNYLNLVNDTFSKCRENIDTESIRLNVNMYSMFDVINSTRDKNKSLINSSLNRFRDRGCIYEYSMIVCDNDGVCYLATDEIKKEIANIEGDTLAKLGCKKKTEAFSKGLKKEYELILKKKLNDYGLQYYFYKYRIFLNNQYKEELKNKTRLTKDVIDTIHQQLNNNVVKSEIESSKKRCEKIKEDRFNVDTKTKKNRFTNGNYVDECIKIINNYVKI